MTLRDLQIFNELAQAGNLTRASERLGLAQPSVSVWLVKMEDQLETKLFHRSRKGLELTDSGARLLEKAKELKHYWDSLLTYVQEGDDVKKVTYRFGCHESVALYSLGKVMPLLQSQAPQVELTLKHDLSRRLTEDIVSGRLDIGIIINPLPHLDLVIKKIGTDQVKFWQTKDCKKPLQLICDFDLKQTQQLLTDWKKLGHGDFESTLTTSSLELAAQLCALGLGRAILPTRVAQKHKSLVEAEGSPVFKDNICLVFKSGFQRSPHARQLIDVVMKAGI